MLRTFPSVQFVPSIVPMSGTVKPAFRKSWVCHGLGTAGKSSGEAWGRFRVRGDGLAVAVFDTGLRTTHVDFAGKVVAQRNFTNDDGCRRNPRQRGHFSLRQLRSAAF